MARIMPFRTTSTSRGLTVPRAMATKSLKAVKRQGGSMLNKKKDETTVQASNSEQPKILTRLEKLKLLSKLEQSGLLSRLEASGITLQFIEENKLLSKAEDLGVIAKVTDRSTPGTLSALGFVLLLAGAGTIFLIPDDSGALVGLQALLAGVLFAGGGAALAGGSFLGNLQKDT